MTARALMIGGTASHVGKSWMATAICRSLHRKGIRVAPFKAQNMSNNSYPCPGGGEIGRAQVAQAQACGLEPSPDMNPILLKPSGDATSQVVVHGQVWRNLSAADYYRQYDYLVGKVDESYARLAAQYEVIVIEGAGGVAELNLRRMDLVNLGLARRLNVPVLLLADIDRGGVFASIYGTIALLEPEEAALVRGFAVNRFRGDPALFADAVPLLENKTAKPCLGVFPFVHDVELDEEDSVSLDHWQPTAQGGPSIAILQFPRVSNHTDFQRLTSALWIQRPLRRQFDLVILPGSKNSVADLQWMRQQKFDLWLHEQYAGGAHILGVCGGYQMLGESIDDPYHVESAETSVPGLGMLPVRTVLQQKKVTQRVTASTPNGHSFPAYEIHMGETLRPVDAAAFAWIDGRPEGIRYGRFAGTYLHSALENPDVLEDWIGFRPPEPVSHDDSYNRLADWFERWVDGPRFERLFLPVRL
ncbi:MAG: cobyric acid synthase [Candidatus Korobacteraceae bacterium]